nr:unnamed protein product [Digitaria exilis]
MAALTSTHTGSTLQLATKLQSADTITLNLVSINRRHFGAVRGDILSMASFSASIVTKFEEGATFIFALLPTQITPRESRKTPNSDTIFGLYPTRRSTWRPKLTPARAHNNQQVRSTGPRLPGGLKITSDFHQGSTIRTVTTTPQALRNPNPEPRRTKTSTSSSISLWVNKFNRNLPSSSGKAFHQAHQINSDLITCPGRYPLVLETVVANSKLTKVLIDGGSGLNLIFAKTLRQMGLDTSKLQPADSPFYGIVPGKAAIPLGQITLPIKFEVADFEISYHTIFGRPALAKFMAIPHYTYLVLKMPGPHGVLSLRGDIKRSYLCDKEAVEYAVRAASTIDKPELYTLVANISDEDGYAPTHKKTRAIKPESTFVNFLRAQADIFTTKPSDMSGVPKELIEHKLDLNESAKPKKQRLRRFATEHREAIKKELAKLLAAGFIKEVFYPDWLANLVLVKKKNSTEWRMCVDYTDLNKHCKKDPSGLPRIDQVIDSTAGCTLLCFLDSYVDDVVVKTRNPEDLIADLTETFDNLRNERGVEANPKKIATIMNMEPPRIVKDDMKLTGCMAALNRFISKLGERGSEFFKLLKKHDRFHIEFRSRTAMKSQVLTDFISEWTEHNLPVTTTKTEHWIMYFDEYEALLHGLKMAISLSIKRLLVYRDSMLVIKQVNKDWNRNHENMDAYCEEVRKLEKHFLGIEFHHVERDYNVAADVLSKLGFSRAEVPSGVANGQVERANGMLLDGLKARMERTLKKAEGRWMKELFPVVWGLRFQHSKATGQFPFFLVCVSEAVLPINVMHGAPCVEEFQEAMADEQRMIEVDTAEEA